MEMIQGAEWGVIIILVVGFLTSMILIISVQGDIRLREEVGENTDDHATDMFIRLVNHTNRQIVIHDDGDNFKNSIYNNEDVIALLRERIRNHKIKVRCLFNYKDQPLKLLELSRSSEFQKYIEVWYPKGGRQEPDIHYKIVDSGKLVHLSKHDPGAIKRGYRLRKALRWWEFYTRHRISKQWQNHFDHSLKNAVRGT